MKIRILICWLVCSLTAACDKDENAPKRVIKGTVLHIADGSPIADVEVSTPPAIGTTNLTVYSTRTNAKGEYALEVPEANVYTRFGLNISKANMTSCYFYGTSVPNLFDTTYMDDASYMRIITKTNQLPPMYQTWSIAGYFVYADNPPLSNIRDWRANDTLFFRNGKEYSTAIAGDTLLITYPHTLFKSGGALFLWGFGDQLVKKPVPLLPLDTTEVSLEY